MGVILGYKFTFQVKVRAADLTLETEKRNNQKLEADLLYWEDALTDMQNKVQHLATRQGLGDIEWSGLEGWKN